MELEEALRIRRSLQDSVALLASPPEAQAAWLRELGVAPLADELALEFNDLERLVPHLGALGVLTTDATRALGVLSAALDQIPGGDEAWRDGALADDVRWEGIRRAAGLALVSLLVSSPEKRSDFVHAN